MVDALAATVAAATIRRRKVRKRSDYDARSAAPSHRLLRRHVAGPCVLRDRFCSLELSLIVVCRMLFCCWCFGQRICDLTPIEHVDRNDLEVRFSTSAISNSRSTLTATHALCVHLGVWRSVDVDSDDDDDDDDDDELRAVREQTVCGVFERQAARTRADVRAVHPPSIPDSEVRTRAATTDVSSLVPRPSSLPLVVVVLVLASRHVVM